MATPFSIVHAGEAVVVVLPHTAHPSWMGELAAFLRMPVVAFGWVERGGFAVRLFGPATELEFSGSGFAAIAHAVWRADLVGPSEPIRLLTAAGPLDAWRVGLGVEVHDGERDLFRVDHVTTVARGELTWPP